MADWHEKPPPDVRSVNDAIRSAENRARDLRLTVQVHAFDWDEVILADEVNRLRRELEQSKAPVIGECEECGHKIVTPLRRNGTT